LRSCKMQAKQETVCFPVVIMHHPPFVQFCMWICTTSYNCIYLLLTLISLLRLWTHNRPFSDFPRLSYDICDTARPYCNITRLTATLRDLLRYRATYCDIARPHSDIGDMCYAASPQVRHCGPNCAMCYATPPTVGAKTRISRDVMHYYIWYPEVQLQDGATLAPPFLKFYLFYRLFLHLADVSQFYSAISVSPFVS
jgi:hypothetical protein